MMKLIDDRIRTRIQNSFFSTYIKDQRTSLVIVRGAVARGHREGLVEAQEESRAPALRGRPCWPLVDVEVCRSGPASAFLRSKTEAQGTHMSRVTLRLWLAPVESEMSSNPLELRP